MPMDEAVIRMYRRLAQTGFEHAGSLDNPSIFLNTQAEGVALCGQAGGDYMNIYVNISGGVIDDIRYLCMCDPTANVVVEILCGLVKGKTIEQAKTLTKEPFFKAIGSEGEIVAEKVMGILELLNRGIKRFEAGTS